VFTKTDPTARGGFGPFTPGFKSIPFGDSAALEAAITPNTVGFMVEPIQGEAGVIIPPEGYLGEVKEICNRHNVTLIFDEIQTGLGRTGKLLADRHEDAEPDVTLIGKALSGGFYPISAVLSNSEVLGVLRPGEHGSTFGGNPLACAVARMALRVLVDEGMVENSAEMGEYFLQGLKQIAGPLVKEVRGKGLMIGIELLPEGGGARQYCERLMGLGVLCKDTHGHTIRVAPPLVITRQEIDWALERFETLLSAKQRVPAELGV
jgi:ornithine--oxo-acid transaminase